MSSRPATMLQTAPYPDELAWLVEHLTYRPGWTFRLIDDHVRERMDPSRPWDETNPPISRGLTLDVITCGYDSYHPDRGENYRVHHYMAVPPATYDERSWRRWLFEQILLIERHEAMEFFTVDGDRPYAPNHGPGNDPYIVAEVTSAEDRRTSFRGEVNPS